MIPTKYRNVSGIQFHVINSEDILKESLGEITSAAMEERGLPKIGGVIDPRSGTMDRNTVCQTCGHNFLNCQGHLMHISFPIPIINVCFASNVLKILRCVCLWCVKLKVGDVCEETLDDKELFMSLCSSRRNRQYCSYCDMPVPILKCKGVIVSMMFTAKHIESLAEALVAAEEKEEEQPWVPSGVDIESVTKQKVVLCSGDVRRILKRVSNEDYAKMGIDAQTSHPSEMVLTLIPVPPPHVRPSVQYSESQKHRSAHGFTLWLQDIVRSKLRLCKLLAAASDSVEGAQTRRSEPVATGIRQATRAARNARNKRTPEQLIYAAYEELCGIVCSFINTESSRSKCHATQAVKAAQLVRDSLFSVQTGKTGQWRFNLFGKRVDFSGRTVACPGSSDVRADEVSFPGVFGSVLTVPTTMRPYNEVGLRERVRLGMEGGVDGATAVQFETGETISLVNMSQGKREYLAACITPGCIVRHSLSEGSYVIQNRQPTLRRGSMMAHRIVHRPDEDVERINTAVVGASNMDFDGDQVNVHVPQGNQAGVELIELMAAGKQIISAQSHRPLFGLIQDTIVGAFRLCDEKVRVPVDIVMQAVASSGNDGPLVRYFDLFGIDRCPDTISGYEFLSLLFPKTFSYKNNTKDVVITNGCMKSGRLCKKTLGPSGKGIVHAMARLEGEVAVIDFLSNSQRMIGFWLSQNALSIGLRECIPRTEAEAERYIVFVNDAVKHANSINLGQEDIVQSGAKGTPVNLAQVQCVVGMQECSMSSSRRVSGVDPSSGECDGDNSTGIETDMSQNVGGWQHYTNMWKRTLPCFPHPKKSENRPNSVQAQGFVKSSFCRGLNPHEMFSHFASSWDALMSTSVRTSQSGYAHRKVAKASEDLVVQYDGSVRHQSTGRVVLFCYGTDGMDGAHLDSVNIPELALNFSGELSDATQNAVNRCKRERRCVLTESADLEDTEVFLPFNLDQRIAHLNQNRIKQVKFAPREKALMSARCSVLLDELCEFLESDEKGGRLMHSNAMLICHLRITLSSPNKLVDACVSVAELDEFFELLRDLYYRGLVQAGEAVGLLSCESQCEPLTQLVLDVFHHTGTDQILSSQGIPRYSELIDGTSSIKTPSMILHLKSVPKMASDSLQLEYMLTRRNLALLASSTRIIYQPNTNETKPMHAVGCSASLINECKTIVHARKLLTDGKEQNTHYSPYVIVLIFKPPHNNVEAILGAIISYLGGDEVCRANFMIEQSTPAMRNNFIRIRMIGEGCKKMKSVLKTTLTGTRSETNDTQKEEKKMFSVTTKLLLKRIMLNVHVGCLDGISSCKICPNGKSVVTVGSSLAATWANEMFDWKKCTSNDVREIERLLGIEAATLVLFFELKNVISSGGSFVADRHMALTASILTNSGTITPLTRHGTHRLGKLPGVISSSFEQQSSHICESAMFSEKSKVNGLADCIVVGEVPRMGTGIVCLVDMDQTSHILPTHSHTSRGEQSAMFVRSINSSDADDVIVRQKNRYNQLTSLLDPKLEWQTFNKRKNDEPTTNVAQAVSNAYNEKILIRPSSPVLIPRPSNYMAPSVIQHELAITKREVYGDDGEVDIEEVMNIVRRIL